RRRDAHEDAHRAPRGEPARPTARVERSVTRAHESSLRSRRAAREITMATNVPATRSTAPRPTQAARTALHDSCELAVDTGPPSYTIVTVRFLPHQPRPRSCTDLRLLSRHDP